jgi:hypothetical protein
MAEIEKGYRSSNSNRSCNRIFSLSPPIFENALKYARLDLYGRDAVEAIIRAEYNRCRNENTLCPAAAYSGRIFIKREEVNE